MSHLAQPDLQALLKGIEYPPEDLAAKTRTIYERLLATSTRVRTGNFSVIADSDLQAIFESYDADFFQGNLRRALLSGGASLHFRLAPRMTRMGGKTSRFRTRTDGNQLRIDFEIAISSTLLFQSFHDVTRPVRINGLECSDRLEAMQRVMEHEIIHLAEMLAWGDSRCSQSNFQTLARRIFGHTHWKHDLVTQAERARENYQIDVGSRVAFEHEGRRYEGFVNRIVRRAVVLVEAPSGGLYADGKRYAKFYVPLQALEKI